MMTPEEREAWLLQRESYVTASDVAAVLGLNPHKSRKAVFRDKVERRRVDIDRLPAVASGRHLEQGIVNWHAEERNLTAEVGFPLTPHPTCKALAATPDAVCTDKNGVRYVTEVKNVGLDKYEQAWSAGWSYLDATTIPAYVTGNAVRRIMFDTCRAPVYYYVQLQAQMACLQIPVGRIVVCFGGQNRVDLDYHAAVEFTRWMLQEVEEFWAQVLEARKLREDT